MTTAVFVGAAFACAVAAAMGQWMRSRGRPLRERVVLCLLPPALVMFAIGAAAEILFTVFQPWNDARLAPAAALVRGYRLYYQPDEGPMLGLMYPPLAALAYLPAVLVASTPCQAVLLGDLLAMTYFFVPALAILSLEARRLELGIAPTVLVLLCFGLLVLHAEPLLQAAFWIHADAPALAFGTAACGLLYFRGEARSITTSMASALALVLAILTKQPTVPLLLALPLCCLVFEGPRSATRYLVCLLVALTAAGAVVASSTDVRALWFQAVTVPARHPWQAATPEAVLTACQHLARQSGGLAVAVGAYTAAEWARGRMPLLQWLRHHRWSMWLLVAATMLPTSVLGLVKVGANLNSAAYTSYFLTIAAFLILLRGLQGTGPLPPSRMATTATAVLALGVVVLLAATSPRLAQTPAFAEQFLQNPERTGFAFATEHPGTIYFPHQPLITLMSDGKAYHFSDGVYQQVLAGVALSPAHLQSGLPSNISAVAFWGPQDFSARYLPDFSEPATIDELPGWTVRRRHGG